MGFLVASALDTAQVDKVFEVVMGVIVTLALETALVDMVDVDSGADMAMMGLVNAVLSGQRHWHDQHDSVT